MALIIAEATTVNDVILGVAGMVLLGFIMWLMGRE